MGSMWRWHRSCQSLPIMAAHFPVQHLVSKFWRILRFSGLISGDNGAREKRKAEAFSDVISLLSFQRHSAEYLIALRSLHSLVSGVSFQPRAIRAIGSMCHASVSFDALLPSIADRIGWIGLQRAQVPPRPSTRLFCQD